MPGPEFKLSLSGSDPTNAPTPKRRAAGIAIGAAITTGALGLALYLGTIGYDIRRNMMHEARLKGILVQEPTVYQVTEGLKEKAPLMKVAHNRTEVEEAASHWGMEKQGEILSKAAKWQHVRVFAAGDMVYFIYFDADDVMRDFVYVSA